MVGPALSALDAQLNFQDPRDATKPKDAKRNASHYAAAQEARNMLGEAFLVTIKQLLALSLKNLPPSP